MVIRSLVVLISAILVGISPTWLNLIASMWGGRAYTEALPFSPYWIALPGAFAIGISWVFEMGSNRAPSVGSEAPAGDVDWLKSRVEHGDRRVAARQPSTTDADPGASSGWLQLETEFTEMMQFGGDLDAVWERTSTYSDAAESWRVTGAYKDVRIEEKFAELADTAGRMLIEGSGYTPALSASTARESSARDRWLCAMRDRAIKTEAVVPGQVMQNGAVTGHVHGGAIRHVIEASVEMCVQLSLEESLEDRADTTASALGAERA